MPCAAARARPNIVVVYIAPCGHREIGRLKLIRSAQPGAHTATKLGCFRMGCAALVHTVTVDAVADADSVRFAINPSLLRRNQNITKPRHL